MKMKHIMVIVAGMAFATVLAEAKGGGDRNCAKKCDQECAQDCTKEQKQDCTKACAKDCDKKQARDGSCGK
jgi:hypothetical protein